MIAALAMGGEASGETVGEAFVPPPPPPPGTVPVVPPGVVVPVVPVVVDPGVTITVAFIASPCTVHQKT